MTVLRVVRHALLCLAALCVLRSSRALAHEAPETSATITLRERSVEVWIDVDVDAWLRATLPAELHAVLRSPLLATPDALARIVHEANRDARAVTLELDRQRIALQLVRGLEIEDVLARIAGRREGGHHRARIALRGPLTGRTERAAIQLPVGFGPVIVNVVRPESRWGTSGARVELAFGSHARTAVRAGLAPESAIVLACFASLGVVFFRVLRAKPAFDSTDAVRRRES